MWQIFIFIGSLISSVTAARTNSDNQIQDSCVLSLTIPRDSIKNNCDMNSGLLRKIQSMESQFSRLQGRLQAMERRLPQILSECSSYQNKVDYLEVNFAKEVTEFGKMTQRIENLESTVESINTIGQEGAQINSKPPISQPDTVLDPVRPFLVSEIHRIKEEIMESLLSQFMNKLSELSDETGSSEENDEQTRTTQGLQPESTNSVVNHTEELTIPLKYANLELLARSMKNLRTKNSTEMPNKTENVSMSHNDTGEEKSMSTIRNVIEATAEILREEMREEVINTRENETMVMAFNMSEVMSKVKDLENKYIKNTDEIQNLKTNQSSDLSQVKMELNSVVQDLEKLERKIDGPLNDLYAESRLEQKFETMETNLQTTIMDRVSSLVRQWENRIQQQDRRINMSTTFVNIFRETLNNYYNNSKVKLRELEISISHLHHNLTNVSRQMRNKNANEPRFENIETQLQEIVNSQFFMETGFSQFKERSTRSDRETQNEIRNLDQSMRQLQIELIETTNLARKTETLEAKQATFTDNLQNVHGTLRSLQMKLALENGEWLQYNFSHSVVKVNCHNSQFIKKNTLYGDVARYVGVVLCSPVRYKIFLGNSLDGEFLDIADKRGHGQDHCEYVGAESETGVNVDMSTSFPGSINVYMRYKWGEKPIIGMLSPLYITPAWYECGIQIP